MTLAIVVDWSWVGPVLAAWLFGPILLICVIYWAGLRAELRMERVSELEARRNAAPSGSVSFMFDREAS